MTDLWLIHPRVVHTTVSLCFFLSYKLESLFGVVQGHISRFVCVTLAGLQFGVGDPPWWCPHIQGVLASLNVVKILDNHC